MLPVTSSCETRADFSLASSSAFGRRLAELGSRRYVDEDGFEFWDLKPDWKPDGIARDYLQQARTRRTVLDTYIHARLLGEAR